MFKPLSDEVRQQTLDTVSAAGGNVTKAARVLGIPRKTLAHRYQKALLEVQTPKAIDQLDALKSKLDAAQKALVKARREADTAASIRQSIYELAAITPEPPKWLSEETKPSFSGVPVGFLSDLHWGETVSKNETGGLNEYNTEIAHARLRRIINSFIDLAKNHMVNPSYPGFVLVLGGDIINGALHEDALDTNDMYVQESLLDVEDQLIAAITTLADTFGKVFVPCVVGNHARMSKKPRAKGRVFTSVEWNLYCHLERWFKAKNDSRVQFCIPDGADAFFTVANHRFMLTHGDSLGVKGGDGIIGCLGPIARGATKISVSEAQVGRDFDTLLIGHYHTFIPRGEAIPVIANGCLVGYNEFARLAMRSRFSHPSQALFFVHPKHGVTAQWQVFAESSGPVNVSEDDWVRWKEK